jgi:hypothetical protein
LGIADGLFLYEGPNPDDLAKSQLYGGLGILGGINHSGVT